MNDIYTISMILSIATFTLTMNITPGPTNIILLSSVLNFGYKRSLPFMIATIISYPLMMIFVGLGVGMFLIQHPTIMTILKVVGVLYLCWMAWKIATSTKTYDSNDDTQAQPFTFWQGFLYPWINIKAWIVYSATISMFVTSSDNSFLQVSIIALFVFITMIITSYTWSFGGIILKQLMKNENFIRKLNLSMAILLIISILPILI